MYSYRERERERELTCPRWIGGSSPMPPHEKLFQDRRGGKRLALREKWSKKQPSQRGRRRAGCSAAISLPRSSSSSSSVASFALISLSLSLYPVGGPSPSISASPSLSTTRCHKQSASAASYWLSLLSSPPLPSPPHHPFSPSLSLSLSPLFGLKAMHHATAAPLVHAATFKTVKTHTLYVQVLYCKAVLPLLVPGDTHLDWGR